MFFINCVLHRIMEREFRRKVSVGCHVPLYVYDGRGVVMKTSGLKISSEKNGQTPGEKSGSWRTWRGERCGGLDGPVTLTVS